MRYRHRTGRRRTAWQDSGYVFTTQYGVPLHPDYLTRRFRRWFATLGCPRSGRTTCATAPPASPTGPAPAPDQKTVQEQLGHTSIVLTADTYPSVLFDLHFKTAEATARCGSGPAART